MLKSGVLLLFLASLARAYSVLSHEALVDALWDLQLKAIVLARFPTSTPEQLKEAHGYAYGGAIIQDLGYYPHGSTRFSDLTHYVRTGDFILALISGARDLNQYAFALGALSHYVSDQDGHRYATNIGEPMLYPKLRRKYGDLITYEDCPVGHLQTEFGFDVLEVARGNFAPQAYHEFIGFYVATDLVKRAFEETYGLELSDLFSDFDRAIESYRWAVSKSIPKATRVAWVMRKHQIQQSLPGITRRHFTYVMKRSSYERDWGKRYDVPKPGEQVIALLLRLAPPVGPLRALHFRMPTPQVERLFMESFDRSAAQYRDRLNEARSNTLRLEDTNYDVGVLTPAGIYRLKDQVQGYWLDELAKKKFRGITPAIANEILSFYSDLTAPIDTKKHPDQWKRIQSELEHLKMITAALKEPTIIDDQRNIIATTAKW